MKNYKHRSRKRRFKASEPGRGPQTTLIIVLCFVTLWILLIVGGIVAACYFLKSSDIPAISALVGAGAITVRKILHLFKRLPGGKGP